MKSGIWPLLTFACLWLRRRLNAFLFLIGISIVLFSWFSVREANGKSISTPPPALPPPLAEPTWELRPHSTPISVATHLEHGRRTSSKGQQSDRTETCRRASSGTHSFRQCILLAWQTSPLPAHRGRDSYHFAGSCVIFSHFSKKWEDQRIPLFSQEAVIPHGPFN